MDETTLKEARRLLADFGIVQPSRALLDAAALEIARRSESLQPA
ncbi:MAG: hypothetical protein AB1758_11635 [Candidatus Eremiobacterota bacterium]